MRWEAEVKELGEVCSFQRGLTYAKGDEVDLSQNVVLRANNISMATNALDFAELKYIKDSIAIPESKLVRRDTLMICTASGSKSHLGKVAYVDDDYGYAFGGFMGLLVPEREVGGRYLYYAMLSEVYKEFIDGLSDGVNINNLKWDDLKSFTLPVPPLPEQQRIVGKLDAAFAALAEAQDHVERNRANARELFESYLNGVFEGKGGEWKEVRLGDICQRVSVGHVGPTSEFYCEPSEGVPILRSQNVRRGRLNWDGIQHITKAFHKQLKKSQLKYGDLLFVRVGANRGDCCALQEEVAELNCANIVFARPSEGNAVFLEGYCQSRLGREQLLGMTTGSAQGVINTSSVAELLVPLPSEAVQKDIVAKLRDFKAQSDQLETTYQQKLTELAGLKKSILGAAFRGEL